MGRRRGKGFGSLADAAAGLARAGLLFGSIAAALALIVLPDIDRRNHGAEVAPDLDATMTGSIAPAPERQGLEWADASRLDQGPCLMFPDGTERGACR
ncbi:hypothetical protein [Aureimonas endophytica]|nr:hypothetical protein [Aureimonas endophytica]